MRGSFGLLRNTNGIVRTKVIGEAAKLVSCSTFSTSSGPGGGGGGRGRGRGSVGPIRFGFVAGNSHPGEGGSNDSNQSYAGMGRGHGHGRGVPLPSTPFAAPNQPPQQQPSFGVGRGRGEVVTQESGVGNDGVNDSNQSYSGMGRGHSHGRGVPLPSTPFAAPNQPPQQQPSLGSGSGQGQGRVGVNTQESGVGNEGESRPKGPIFLRKDETTGKTSVAESVVSVPSHTIGEKRLPQNLMTALTGTGRGRGVPEMRHVTDERPKEENRHLRLRREPGDLSAETGKDKMESKQKTPKLSREEAVKRAVGILASKDDGRQEGGSRARGLGRGRGRGRYNEDEDEDEGGLFLGNDTDGEKLAKTLGPKRMADLNEMFEEAADEVLPDLERDKYIEALDLNLKHELEPEYLFGDFETNPDINDTPPLSLRDALEKAKPFLMVHDGIQSQQEWEEVMKETMETVPLLKEIVDHYAGPDNVTSKQQHGELVRVAKTLPPGVPNAVTTFTDRAVLSLQSNPGWGFHRKWQFMDKLVNEFSQSK